MNGLHLNLPASVLPMSAVKLSPAVPTAILDHYLRRSPPELPRVIGTLLGRRSDDGRTIEIGDCFPVPHTEEKDQIAVDMEHHRTMFDLHRRVNPKEVIVGWYATGPGINPYAALVHEFFATEAANFPIVHLTIDTSLTNGKLDIQAYYSSPMGVTGKAENCMFISVPCHIATKKAERVALDAMHEGLISSEGNSDIMTDFVALEKAIVRLQELLDRVISYVEAAMTEETKADPVVGRLLMDTVTSIPHIEADDFEKAFNAHLQDLLMVLYLSELTKSQLALSESMQMVA